jgi:hypothetical protein
MGLVSLSLASARAEAKRPSPGGRPRIPRLLDERDETPLYLALLFVELQLIPD